ncbi:MAG: Rrf2 family transcriptional regulator [Pseudomonadota bacterium]
MRLTRATEYSVRCILYLAQQDQGVIANRKEIAKAMEIPHQFLGKIAQNLAKQGIIEIVQGAKGGLRLKVPPERLTLLDVVEAEIGEIFLNDCVLRPDSCRRSPSCSVHKVWVKARDQLRDTLMKVTISSLLKEDTCMDSLLNNQCNEE